MDDDDSFLMESDDEMHTEEERAGEDIDFISLFRAAIDKISAFCHLHLLLRTNFLPDFTPPPTN